MSSQVFYRKWRSQTLADIVGQPHVTRTLLNALKTGRVSHAYLFCGPRGTGKTSTSRILAKAINCLTNDGKNEPCNTCHICTAVTEGRSLDVLEIDAASNTGVDNIRELIERVNYAPNEARYKVYIIDEVHMLSTSASNALLKTLEEPPPHVIFVLATTETHKVLPTILSRCQRFDFHRISQLDIVDRLAFISKLEGIEIAPDGLKLIARGATGSLRDAINILEQMITYYGNHIELTQIQSTLGIIGDWRAKELVKYIVANDIASGIKTIQSVNNDGLDLKQFNREVVEFLRGLLLVKNNVTESGNFSHEDLLELKHLSDNISLADILKTLKTFGELQFGFDNYSTLPLELALVESTINGSTDNKGAVPQIHVGTPSGVAEPKYRAKPEASAAKLTAEINNSQTIADAKKHTHSEATPLQKQESPEVKNSELNEDTGILENDDLENLKQNWKRVLEEAPAEVKRTSAIALLRSAKPKLVEGDLVVLTFRYEIHRGNASKPENQRVVDKLVSDFLKRPCKVRCVCEPEENHLVQKLVQMGAQITNVEEKQP